MQTTFIATALAVASLAAVAAPSQAAPRGFDTTLSSPGDGQFIQAQYRRCFDGERYNDCRERGRYERHHHTHYVWRDGRYVDDSNVAVSGGILGFVLGTAIAGNQDDYTYYNSHRNDRHWRDRCRSSYHDFDTRSGTYRGDDGYRHYCRQ